MSWVSESGITILGIRNEQSRCGRRCYCFSLSRCWMMILSFLLLLLLFGISPPAVGQGFLLLFLPCTSLLIRDEWRREKDRAHHLTYKAAKKILFTDNRQSVKRLIFQKVLLKNYFVNFVPWRRRDDYWENAEGGKGLSWEMEKKEEEEEEGWVVVVVLIPLLWLPGCLSPPHPLFPEAMTAEKDSTFKKKKNQTEGYCVWMKRSLIFNSICQMRWWISTLPCPPRAIAQWTLEYGEAAAGGGRKRDTYLTFPYTFPSLLNVLILGTLRDFAFLAVMEI